MYSMSLPSFFFAIHMPTDDTQTLIKNIYSNAYNRFDVCFSAAFICLLPVIKLKTCYNTAFMFRKSIQQISYFHYHHNKFEFNYVQCTVYTNAYTHKERGSANVWRVWKWKHTMENNELKKGEKKEKKILNGYVNVSRMLLTWNAKICLLKFFCIIFWNCTRVVNSVFRYNAVFIYVVVQSVIIMFSFLRFMNCSRCFLN